MPIARLGSRDLRGTEASPVQQLLAVVNRAAGDMDDDSVESALTALREGADVTVAATAGPGELLRAVRGRGDRRLVVIGGDGSVHAAVTALDAVEGLDADAPVGIIPRGTGNDLAQALGLPLDPAESAAVVLTGAPRPLDVVRDDVGGLVVNAVHLGAGARAGAEAARFKDRLGSAAYPLGAVIAGVTTAGWHLRVEVDGRGVVPHAAGSSPDRTTGVLMVGVCNGPTVGGSTPLAPDALVDDGLLDVVVSTATGPLARATFAAALNTGRHVERDDVLVVRGREVSVSGDSVDLVADGELEEGVVCRTWRVEHHAWSVLVPR
ncbi:diacylglycerol kinase family protein [Modestobacter sp. VKM Ac-2983]|uniref:diacylglycerol/lipid kinase family protein n=1 Tax=Modestobacter sp. VKM Ac-2983 TaxID=3004137 RepID=UPI0022AB704E|nr:diacylglycerol kinase family protein [Modestobacter sp. VKM Ac-2983]MCZ2805376.1 diacylglycerol kinase family protein [Modestobacter sp. VKM Ac-2983]